MRPPLVRRLGHAVRRRRVAAGLSQEALARAARVHPTYISLVERGLRDPKISSVRRIARGLRVGAGELVAEAERST